jgi:hypothetical protein
MNDTCKVLYLDQEAGDNWPLSSASGSQQVEPNNNRGDQPLPSSL